MSRQHELSGMAERCRICLADSGSMTSLQDERVETKLKDLTKCTFIDIKCEKNLPGIVCHVCLYKLNMWSEFKKRFVQSHRVLMGQLEMSESDNTVNNSRDERLLEESAKRKRLSGSGEDNISDHDKKKSKIEEVSLSKVADINQAKDRSTLETISIVDDDESTLPENSQKNISDSKKSNKDEGNGNENTEFRSFSGMRARLLPGRRGRALERRKASTKRWVERKKALLAATGENVSDTDSAGSGDNAKLSPVQKARAKTNAEKEAERQKRIAKVLKNLEVNLTEKYTVIHDSDHIVGDTDSDMRITRLSKELHSNKKSLLKKQDSANKRGLKSSSRENSMGKENSPLKKTVRTYRGRKPGPRAHDEIFLPNLMKSELVIGNVKYVVTSTLILAGSSHNQEDVNNLTKDSKNVEESGQEKNTDIIDAVQLRRVHPLTSNLNKRKSVERCLNIEVEGTELETLKRAQIELADFVEKEMKQKLFSVNGESVKTDNTENVKPHWKLDQQLKNMIEKVIKNNIGSSLIRDSTDASAKVFDKSTRVSPAFLKTAKNSSKYQPKIMIKRLDIAKESKLYKINNIHALNPVKPRKLAGPFSAITRKRQIVPPIRYNDYNTSALDSDSEESRNKDIAIQETPRTTMNVSNLRTYRNLAAKQPATVNSQIAIVKRDNPIVKAVTPVNNVTPINITSVISAIKQNSLVAANEQKPSYEESVKIEEVLAQNHICGVCGLTFSSRKDVEVHVQNHKVASAAESGAVAQRSAQKQKMMRCKRCQEIVEARYVKAHVCKTMAHKCYVCNSTFRTEKLLVQHLENHDQSEFSIDNITKIETKKPDDTEACSPKLTEKPEQKTANTMQQMTVLTEKNDIQSDKITSTDTKLDDADVSKETYTCFVCDKIFTDKEILKDHLQKHCDDLSEGEQSNSKEQYQCAICGDTLESDQALEEHVGKHLFDDEDDNPNLISIKDQDKEKSKSNYHCNQCLETFESEVLLEMHVQEHEEDAAIAEWEKKGLSISPYQCMLCDENIDTEAQLIEHLDVIHDIHNNDMQVCQLCDRQFRTLEELQEHVATH